MSTRREILNARRREWDGDKTLYGMDGPTALAFCFKQPAPKGLDWALELPMGIPFQDWLLDENQMPYLVERLTETYEQHFKGRKRNPLSWEQIAYFVELMSNRRWAPSPEMCQGLHQTQAGV
jgi:hypothetical protein